MQIAFLDADSSFLWRAGLAVALPFLVGLEFHKYQRSEAQGLGFGTARTLTLVGLLGFLLPALDSSGLLYGLGFAGLVLWLALYYRKRLDDGYALLMAPLVCLLVYVLGLLAGHAPPWLSAAYAVLIVLVLSSKPRIHSFADSVPGQEIATLVKFLIMAGIVLPLLPDQPIAAFVPVTYRQTWFAVIAISGISYLSYVAQTYVFKSRGTLLTGLLGGLYSSTAATFVLGQQARSAPNNSYTSPALVLATGMMYVRLLVLCGMLAPDSLTLLTLPFGVAAFGSGAAALLMLRWRGRSKDSKPPAPDRHPLEFHAALVFALLFVLFATATQYVVGRYSGTGLHFMALIVGFTDIDPFVLSVLTGKMDVSLHMAVDAVLLATASNNLLKAGYAFFLARNRSVLPACVWLSTLTLLSLVYVFV